MKQRALLAIAAVGVGLCGAVSAQIIEEDAKLLVVDGERGDRLGRSVDSDNGVLVVGANDRFQGDAQTGAAFVFDLGTGKQLHELLPSDGASGDDFGLSVAISDDAVVVGAPGHDEQGSTAGAAYVFDVETGEEVYKLLAADGAARASFGSSVAIGGDLIIVGANLADGRGAVYVFSASTGEQLRKLIPDPGKEASFFGDALAIHSGIIAVGAPFEENPKGVRAGAVYLFDAATGSRLYTLVQENGDESDQFGSAVAIDESFVAVGAFRDNELFENAGSVSLFSFQTGKLVRKLLPVEYEELEDRFGYAVDLDDGVLAIGASTIDNGRYSGSVLIYDAATGQQILQLHASDGTLFDYLGDSVTVDEGVVVGGAAGDDNENGMDAGAVYVVELLSQRLSCLRYPRQVFETGSSPRGVAVGDVNGDGLPDIVGANSSSDDVSVLLNAGEEGFAPAVSFNAGDGPISVALVDADGDDDLDIAVANANSDDVSVLLNDGSGAFAFDAAYLAGDQPAAIAAGDLNGDDAPDLVVSSVRSDDVSVLLNAGGGTFAPAVVYPAGNSPGGLAIGDINGDQPLDIVVASAFTDEAVVLLGRGDGAFDPGESPIVGDRPRDVELADLDGDSVLDLVAVMANRSASVLLGLGDGSFAAPASFELNGDGFNIAVGDLDGDGNLDVVAGLLDEHVRALFGDGAGGFEFAINYETGGFPRGVVVGDLDGDRDTDLAISVSGESSGVDVRLNECDPACRSDWDANGVVNAADVGAFLSDYFLDVLNGTLVADFDGNGVVNPADVGAFLSVYFPELNAPACG